ncbi:hypothetical protein ACJX0J_015193 [Zea mays]
MVNGLSAVSICCCIATGKEQLANGNSSLMMTTILCTLYTHAFHLHAWGLGSNSITYGHIEVYSIASNRSKLNILFKCLLNTISFAKTKHLHIHAILSMCFLLLQYMHTGQDRNLQYFTYTILCAFHLHAWGLGSNSITYGHIEVYSIASNVIKSLSNQN